MHNPQQETLIKIAIRSHSTVAIKNSNRQTQSKKTLLLFLLSSLLWLK